MRLGVLTQQFVRSRSRERICWYGDHPVSPKWVLEGQTRQVTNSYAAKLVLEAGQLMVVINPPGVATNGDLTLRG